MSRNRFLPSRPFYKRQGQYVLRRYLAVEEAEIFIGKLFSRLTISLLRQ